MTIFDLEQYKQQCFDQLAEKILFVLMAAFGWWQWEQVKRKQQTKLVI